MTKKSAAHQKKVNEAVRILNTTTGVIVPQAMILAGFPKKDITNETVRRMIRRRLEALEAKQMRPRRVVTNNDADLSTLTGEDDDPTASVTTITMTTTTGPAQHPKPKRKQIRLTASAVQQRRVDNLAAKRHKSDAHKAAVRLFKAEKQKPDGMSIRWMTMNFLSTFKKIIMKLFPDAAPMRRRWVILKCDSGLGRLNPTLLAYLRFHGFILYPGVPNTTAVTQETDQSYGPFQTAVHTNLQVIIDERIATDKTRTLSPWIIGLFVFGGEDPKTGLIVGFPCRGKTHCALNATHRCAVILHKTRGLRENYITT